MSKNEKFNLIYEKYHGYLKHLCYTYVKDCDAAEDCMQDAFIKIYNNLDKVDLNECSSFLTTITRNNVIDYMRKNKYSKQSEDVFSCANTSLRNYCTDVDSVQYSDIRDFIDSHASEIGDINYRIFCMYVYDDLKHKDIARKLNMNINTVRVNYMKAKRAIKKILKNEFKK